MPCFYKNLEEYAKQLVWKENTFALQLSNKHFQPPISDLLTIPEIHLIIVVTFNKIRFRNVEQPNRWYHYFNGNILYSKEVNASLTFELVTRRAQINGPVPNPCQVPSANSRDLQKEWFWNKSGFFTLNVPSKLIEWHFYQWVLTAQLQTLWFHHNANSASGALTCQCIRRTSCKNR